MDRDLPIVISFVILGVLVVHGGADLLGDPDEAILLVGDGGVDPEEPVGLVESDHIGEEVRVAALQLTGPFEQFLGAAFSFNFRNSALISLIFDDLIK